MSDMPEKIQVTKVFPSGDRVNTWREGSPYVHGTEYTRSDLIEQLQAEVDALKREVDEQNKTANYYRQETIDRGVEKKQLQAKVEKLQKELKHESDLTESMSKKLRRLEDAGIVLAASYSVIADHKREAVQIVLKNWREALQGEEQ